METIWIATSAWMIEDGNYREFRVGQQVRFALSAAPQILQSGVSGGPLLNRMRRSRYRFHGRMAYRAADGWVLDIGFPVFVEGEPPAFAPVGSWLSGELVLGLAPLFYLAQYARGPGALPLICPWRIDRVLRNVTPLIASIDGAGRRIVLPDEQQEAFVEARGTDVRTYRNRDYLMECTRLGRASWRRFEPPSRADRAAMEALGGARVSIQIEARGDDADGPAPAPMEATVLQVSGHQSRDQMGLLRLDCPLIHAERAYEYVVAYPRYEGEGFGRVAVERCLFCSLKWLPADLAAYTPFEPRCWPSGPGLAVEVRIVG